MSQQKEHTEIEQDLKTFLQAIKPILKAVESNQNRSTLYIVSKLVKDVANDKEFLKDLKECAPLLVKYKYLIKEE
jgi:hypothetical protein